MCTTLCGTGEECSEARRPRLESVSVSCQDKFLGGGSGGDGGGGGLDEPGIFSAQRFCLYGQRTLQSLISPQQINTQAFIVKGPEQRASELILDTSDDSNYSFSAKPAVSFHQEKPEIWLLSA